MIVREIVDPNGAVLVHRELESGVLFVRDESRHRAEGSCGILPQRFIALVPIPKGSRGGAVRGNRPSFGLGPWDGARVGPHRSPILRPRHFRVYLRRQRQMSTAC